MKDKIFFLKTYNVLIFLEHIVSINFDSNRQTMRINMSKGDGFYLHKKDEMHDLIEAIGSEELLKQFRYHYQYC